MKLRWGILGTGNIARQFCVGVNASRRSMLSAVGSRSAVSAATFAQTHRIATAHASYDDLLADRDVQAIYVSLPNSMHHEWTIKALRAGKHVLCEKPIAINAAQSEEMFDVAQHEGRVLIEGFMYRAHPLTKAIMDVIRAGEIGTLQLIRTSFCYRTSKVAGNIRFDPKLAGGALMDIGCYCINFSRLFAGEEPAAMSAVGRLHSSGVDQLAAGTMAFPSGIIASFTCGMSVQSNNAAYLCGDNGYVEVPVPWKPPEWGATFSVVRATPPRMDQPAGIDASKSRPNSGPRREVTIDANTELYGLEADDFAATVLDGKPPMLSRQDSVGNMRVLDEMRRQVTQSCRSS
jgi:xylose dehydrogenase (NAD/NADP)